MPFATDESTEQTAVQPVRESGRAGGGRQSTSRLVDEFAQAGFVGSCHLQTRLNQLMAGNRHLFRLVPGDEGREGTNQVAFNRERDCRSSIAFGHESLDARTAPIQVRRVKWRSLPVKLH